MKKLSEKQNNIVFLFAVFLLMLVLNILTPMVSDDFSHYYGMMGKHCQTIGQILDDMVLFRQTVNGRVFPHFFVYLFLMMPKMIFNIANALMAALLAYNISRYSKKTCVSLILCAFLLWIFIPDFGQVFLWLTGSVNYLWGLVIFTTFLFPYYCALTGKDYKFNIVLYSSLGLALGAWSENGATASIFACGIMGLFIWVKEKKFPLKLFIPFIFCLMGYAFLMSAPATTETRAGGDILENIWFIRVCLKDFCLFLFIAYFILLVTALILKKDRMTIVFTLIMAAAGMVSILVFIFAVYLPPRSFYVIVTFLIISCLVLLNEINIKKADLTLITLVSVVFIIKLVPGISDIINLHDKAMERQKLLSQSTGNVIIESYSAKTKYAAVYTEELSEDSTYWYNDLVAKYYDVNSVCKSGNS